MKIQDINYAPLQKMDKSFGATVRQTFHAHPALVVIGLIVIGLMSLVLLKNVLIPIVLISAFSAYIGKKTFEYKEGVWKAFAAVNGWSVTPGSVAPLVFVPPSLVNTGGRSRKLGDIVHADIDGHMCSVYMFQFTTGSGRSRQVHFYTIARVVLERQFPHIILDSKSSWALRDRGSATANVKLEGDFNKYFSLYFDKGEHIDALSIVTPDVMQTLIKSNQSQDIEIVDNNIFFMSARDRRNDKVLPGLFVSVDALADEIGHKAKTIQYKTDRVPNQTHLTQLAADYFKSGDKVISNIAIILIILFLMPFIAMIVIGFVSSLAGR